MFWKRYVRIQENIFKKISMTATTTSPEKQITLDTPDLKMPDDAKLKQEILDLKITGIDNDSNITPELLEKYTIWRRTNQKLDALKLWSSLSLAQFEEKLESNISGDEVASDAVKTAVEDATTAWVAASSEVTDAVVQAAKTNIFSSTFLSQNFFLVQLHCFCCLVLN